MAKVALSVLVSDVRNRLGNVVFSKWKKTNYVRQYVNYSRGSSVKQQEIRDAFALLISVWKAMGTPMQSTWNMFTRDKNMTGLNAFVGANSAKVVAGEPLELFKPMGEEPPAALSAVNDPSAGSIECTFTLPEGPEDRRIIFFCQELSEDRLTNIITRHEAIAVSPYTITGLVPGVSYIVYAVLANNAYTEAQTLSSAVYAVAQA